MSLTEDLNGNLALLFSFCPVFAEILGISSMFLGHGKMPHVLLLKLFFFLLLKYLYSILLF